MIKKGIAISKLLKTLKARNVAKKAETVKKAATEKRRVHSKTTRTNFKRARCYSSTQSVKPYNIVAGARDTKIIPVKKMSQKGSTFKTHKVRGSGGTGARGMGSRGLGSYSHESWRRDMDRFKPIPMSELLRGVFKKKK